MSLFDNYGINSNALNGLNKQLATSGDNLSNAGTIGFKKSGNEFEEVLSEAKMGMDGGQQSGGGMRLSKTKMDMSQGEIMSSESSTDLAIQGDGFLAVETKSGRAYTRDGSLRFDKDGYLTTSDGLKVLGYLAGPGGKFVNAATPIKFSSAEKVPGQPTTTSKLILNLDATAAPKVFDPQNPKETSNFAYSLPITDSKGNRRIVDVYFNKTAPGQWAYHAIVAGKNTQGGVEGQNSEMATGTLSFNNKGELESHIQNTSSFTLKDVAPQNITFDFGTPVAQGGEAGKASTQYGTNSAVHVKRTNGKKAGSLAGVNFNDKGVLTASYTNGDIKDHAQLALGKFTSVQGLKKMSKNLYTETATSGQVALGKPGEQGRGVVRASSLEVSNVDTNAEMIEMMQSQRNFNASARAFTTADELIKSTIAIKD